MEMTLSAEGFQDRCRFGSCHPEQVSIELQQQYIECCEKVFAPSADFFYFADLSHLNVFGHPTNKIKTPNPSFYFFGAIQRWTCSCASYHCPAA